MSKSATRLFLLLVLAALVPACGGGGSTGVLVSGGSSPDAVQFSAATYTTVEGAGIVTIAVTRTGGTGAVSVEFATSDATATAGVDYTARNGTLSWAPGDVTPKTFDVAIAAGDTVIEGSETFKVTLSLNAGGVPLGTLRQATVTINDVDAPAEGVFQFSSPSYTVSEGSGTVQATITVLRVSGASGPASVGVNITDGTTTAGADYTDPITAPDFTLTWADGEAAAKTFTVEILDDAADAAGTETATLTLAGPTGGVLGTANTSSAGLQIVDNDVAGNLKFTSAASSQFESSGNVVFTVSRVDGSMGTASADIAITGTAVAGTDFTAPAATITLAWADGDVADKTFTVTLLDDAIADGSTTLIATLTNVVGATAVAPLAHTATLLDDEGGVFIFNASVFSVTEGDAGTTTVDVVVNRAGGSLGAASVEVAIADGTATVANADYVNPGTQTLTWVNGEDTPKTFQIVINGDLAVEPNETINLTLQNPLGGILGGTIAATVNIANTDVPTQGTIQFALANTYLVNESAGTITITFSRVGGSTGAVGCTVVSANGTAKSNGNPNSRDYVKIPNATTVTWADTDVADKTVVITILNNDTVGDAGDETFTVTISTPTGGATLGGTTTQTVHIIDD